MKTEETAIELYVRHPMPSVRDIVATLFRQRRILIIAFVLILAAVAVSGFWVPKYEAEMKILVRRQRSDAVVTSSSNAPEQLFSDQVSEEDLNSEVELLKSEDLLRKVVLATGLSGSSDAHDAHRNDVLVARAIRLLATQLKVERLNKSNVISVGYASRDPRQAASVLHALGIAYMQEHMALHRSSGEFEFFDQQLQHYKAGLEQSQAKLTDFTKKTGVVSAGVERDSALRQATDFDTIGQQAKDQILETRHRVAELKAQLQTMNPRITTVVRSTDNSQLFEHLKSTLLDLQLKRTVLIAKYAPTYPLVKEVDQQIAETQNSIAAEENKPLRESSSDRDPNYQWVQDELTKSQAELGGLESRASAAAASAAQYRASAERLDQNALAQQDLQRAARTDEENYLLYVHKREEARISDALDQRGIVNVAIAQKPEVPALPTKSTFSIALLTLLLAGAGSLGTAFAFDYLDPSFRTPDELANYLGSPVLAALPKHGE
jgi:uncharacterized protein involved in exopolysaccharide biosynthesis